MAILTMAILTMAPRTVAQAEQLARQRGVSKARFLELEEQRVTKEQREAARKGRLVRWIPPTP